MGNFLGANAGHQAMMNMQIQNLYKAIASGAVPGERLESLDAATQIVEVLRAALFLAEDRYMAAEAALAAMRGRIAERDASVAHAIRRGR